MPSWPAVIVGAVVVGALLGSAQKDEVDVADDTVEQITEDPAPSTSAVAPPPPPDTPANDTSAPRSWPAGVWTTLPPRESPRIALTFDDGPHPTWTPRLLDVLDQHGAQATFCVVADQIPGNEAVLRRIHADGHVLCNHTATHDYGLPARSTTRIRSEIESATNEIRRAVPDAEVDVFRAPGGRFSPALVDAADAQGLTSWAWSIDPQDWRADDPDAIVSSVLDALSPDAVVLLHDGGGDRAATVAAMGELIPLLASVGYQFVGLPADP